MAKEATFEETVALLPDEDRKVLQDDLKASVSSPEGARVFIRRLYGCHLFVKTFTGNSSGFHDEGRRSIALSEMKQIIWALRIEGPYEELKLLAILLKTGGYTS